MRGLSWVKLTVPKPLDAVGEGALQGAHVHDADCPDGHLADCARVDDRHREVAGEGERKVRIRQHEAGATTDGVQAGLQGEPGRVLVVEREAIGRVDRADGLQRDAAVERVRRWRAARPDRAQHRRTDQSVERASNDALSCLHFRALLRFSPSLPTGLGEEFSESGRMYSDLVASVNSKIVLWHDAQSWLMQRPMPRYRCMAPAIALSTADYTACYSGARGACAVPQPA